MFKVKERAGKEADKAFISVTRSILSQKFDPVPRVSPARFLLDTDKVKAHPHNHLTADDSGARADFNETDACESREINPSSPGAVCD